MMSDIYIPNNYTIFVNPTERSISQRKLENYINIAKIRSYYQRNPIKFMQDVLGAELFDAQTYAIASSWNIPYSLWVCTRGFGKSTIIDLIIMAKGMLFNNYWSYIASGTGDQAIQTFKTLENIANKNIESMTGLTNVFKQQIEVKNASGDGFVHNPAGHFYNLYNGSFTKTLNSNIDRRRGKKNNLLFI
jgi:putative prophage, terminase, ATPase subunit